MFLLVAIGIVLLAVGVYNLINILIFRKYCKETVTAELVDIEEHIDYNRYIPRSKCYSPVYSYTVGEKEYKYSPKSFVTDPMIYDKGSKVEIKYCQTNPNMCFISKKPDKLYVVFICFALGLSLCFVALK